MWLLTLSVWCFWKNAYIYTPIPPSSSLRLYNPILPPSHLFSSLRTTEKKNKNKGGRGRYVYELHRRSPHSHFPYLSIYCIPILSFHFLFPLLMGGGIACLFCSGHVLVFWYWSCLFVWVCLGGGGGCWGGGRCLLSRGIGKVVGWGDWGV